MNEVDQQLSNDPDRLLEMFQASIGYQEHLCFLLDANADHNIARKLIDKEIDVTTAQLEGIADLKSDFEVLRYATDRGCVLITRDRDFKEINDILSQIEGALHAGIIFAKTNTARRDPALTVNFILKCVAEGRPDMFENKLVPLSAETKYTDYV